MSDQVKTRARRVEHEPIEGMPTIYTNSVVVGSSVFDFLLYFGQLRTAEEDVIKVDQLVRIAMSPQHAKSMIRILEEKLDEYEARFGPIPVAPVKLEDAGPEQPS